jgi:hypothetical protein
MRFDPGLVPVRTGDTERLDTGELSGKPPQANPGQRALPAFLMNALHALTAKIIVDMVRLL